MIARGLAVAFALVIGYQVLALVTGASTEAAAEAVVGAAVFVVLGGYLLSTLGQRGSRR